MYKTVQINALESATPTQNAARAQKGGHHHVVRQGDIYWVPLLETDGREEEHIHPHVVIQDDVINHSRVSTVVVCALTSNLKRAKSPGNVLLAVGEANLPRQSVVVVSQVSAVPKTQLGEYIGSLTVQRIAEIFAGMRFVQTFSAMHESGRADQ